MVRRLVIAAFLAVLAVLVVVAFVQRPFMAETAIGQTPPSNPCPLAPITVSAAVPQDTAQTSQTYFDCFAWQEFIGLNWDASPTSAGSPDPNASPSAFGAPLDFAPPVFESYQDALDVFLPGAATPRPWGAVNPSPCAIHGMVASRNRRLLRMSTIEVPGFHGLGSLRQAFPGSGPSWLADKDGDLVWYQILMDHDEYAYIVQRQYYNAAMQLQAVTTDGRIDLPAGTPGGALGAIEVKAAWLPINDKAAQARYRMQRAIVLDEDNQCHTVRVGLVALHIIHKTQSQPTWVWATFEHVDNAPDPGASPGASYTFYRPTCQPSPVPASCVLGKNGVNTSCRANQPPAYEPSAYFGHNTTCPIYPVQASHLQAPDATAATVNAYAAATIRAQDARSVYQYYRLVNVLWASNSADPNAGPSPPVAPVHVNGITPPATQPVANVVTETYAQTMTCLACHASARIAQPLAPQPHWTPYFADFSFVLSQAQTPAPSGRPR